MLSLSFIALVAFLPSRAFAANYEELGISSMDLTEFLTSMHSAAISGSPSDICDLLAYPIDIGRGSDGIISITSKRDCIDGYKDIFTKKILVDIGNITDKTVKDVQSMLMAYDGELWISKYYVSDVPMEKNPDRMKFNDKNIWKMKIVQVNIK